MGTLALQGRNLELDAAILDLDGTLVDTLGDFTEALGRMLAELALPAVGPEPVSRMVGKGSEHLLVSVLNYAFAQQGRELSAIEMEAIYARAWPAYQRHYQDVNGQRARVYPGVCEGLEALSRAGLRLACVTNKPTAFAAALLDATGLAHHFEQLAGGDAFERKKPDPQPLLRTCAALGTTPRRTLMIGDSANDAQAARAAGCPVLLVTYGYNHGRPAREVDADAWLDSLAALAPAFAACVERR